MSRQFQNRKSSSVPIVAVLYQESPSITIAGLSRRCYADSYREFAADIAYALIQSGVSIVTLEENPLPEQAATWVFPDTEKGINEALAKGANTLWPNTNYYPEHPFTWIDLSGVSIVGQSVEADIGIGDKFSTNRKLRNYGLSIPPDVPIAQNASDGVFAWKYLINDLGAVGLSYPVICKPIRGGGSSGVNRFDSHEELFGSLADYFSSSQEHGPMLSQAFRYAFA